MNEEALCRSQHVVKFHCFWKRAFAGLQYSPYLQDKCWWSKNSVELSMFWRVVISRWRWSAAAVVTFIIPHKLVFLQHKEVQVFPALIRISNSRSSILSLPADWTDQFLLKLSSQSSLCFLFLFLSKSSLVWHLLSSACSFTHTIVH